MDPRTEGHLPTARDPVGKTILTLLVIIPTAMLLAMWLTHDLSLTFVGYHLTAVLAAAIGISLVYTGSWRSAGSRVGLTDPSGEGWAAGVVTGTAIALPAIAVAVILGDRIFGLFPLGIRLSSWGVPIDAELGLIVYLVLVKATVEEGLWRGFLQTELSARWAGKAGYIAPAIAYTSYHVYPLQAIGPGWRVTALGTALLLTAALLWGFLREEYDSLLPALVSHGIGNAGLALALTMIV